MIVMMLVIKVTITLLLTIKEGDPISLVNICRDGFSWGLNIASTDVTVETEELVCNSLQLCIHFPHFMRFHVVLIVLITRCTPRYPLWPNLEAVWDSVSASLSSLLGTSSTTFSELFTSNPIWNNSNPSLYIDVKNCFLPQVSTYSSSLIIMSRL